MTLRQLLICLLTAFSLTQAAASTEEFPIGDLVQKGVSLDLRNPSYSNGILKTVEGGVVTAPGLRIQAKKITYFRHGENEDCTEWIEAEGDLMVHFGEYLFVGSKLTYQITNHTGIVEHGRGAIEPWYFGGQTLELCCDKSFIIHNGYITTSGNIDPEWAIVTDYATLSNDKQFNAKNIKVSILKVPFFWMPSFKMDLSTIFESPLRYMVRWGGVQGPRVRMIYEFFSWERFRAFARLDYRLNRGPGFGIETNYCSADHRETFETISYAARDSAIQDPHERFRYRLQGRYKKCLGDNRSSIMLSYDKLSDKDMAEDYADETLTIEEVNPTELILRHQDNNWIANFLTRVQINNFQTVNQEIPTLEIRARPFQLFKSGIVGEGQIAASYLEYDYASSVPNVHDYHSTRFEMRNSFYRPFNVGCFNITPSAGWIGIQYGNSPEKECQNMVSGLFSISANSHLYRCYGNHKHVIEPYANYQYYTSPNSSPNEHFIFDIEDGWYRLDHLRLGINNQFYYKEVGSGCVKRLGSINIFSDSFFDTKTIPESFYKIFADISWMPYSRLRYNVTTGWNFKASALDFINYRMEWTLSENIAIAAEYRHRGRFAWRKVDYDNYILDSFRSINELLHSSLSDKRDTFLLHTFYRFHPLWAIDYQVRHGWNRHKEKNYTETQIDLITNISSAWSLKLSYQNTEDDHRVAFYFNLGPKRPNREPCQPTPCIEY